MAAVAREPITKASVALSSIMRISMTNLLPDYYMPRALNPKSSPKHQDYKRFSMTTTGSLLASRPPGEKVECPHFYGCSSFFFFLLVLLSIILTTINIMNSSCVFWISSMSILRRTPRVLPLSSSPYVLKLHAILAAHMSYGYIRGYIGAIV